MYLFTLIALVVVAYVATGALVKFLNE